MNITLPNLQTRREKNMFTVAAIFSTLVWGGVLAAIASPLYIEPIVKPCVWQEQPDEFYTDYFEGYFPISTKEKALHFAHIPESACVEHSLISKDALVAMNTYFTNYSDEYLDCILPESMINELQTVPYTYEFANIYTLTSEQRLNIECLDQSQVPATTWQEAYIDAQKSTINPGWFIAGAAVAFLLYLGLFLAIVIVAQGIVLAYIRLNGVQLSVNQYQTFYNIYTEVAKELHITHVPEAYIIDQGGNANAFAIKLVRRRMVVFFAELIERLVEEENYDELRAIAAHELTHVRCKHINYALFLLPFKMIPLVGPAYARMQEYTADRGALYIVKDPAIVASALLKIVTGRYVAKQVNVLEYIEQGKRQKGLFVFLAKLITTHPPLPYRIEALNKANS